MDCVVLNKAVQVKPITKSQKSRDKFGVCIKCADRKAEICHRFPFNTESNRNCKQEERDAPKVHHDSIHLQRSWPPGVENVALYHLLP